MRILGDIAYARSGDKGPNVNVGVIFKNSEDYKKALTYMQKMLYIQV